VLATVFETFAEQGKREHKKAKKNLKKFLGIQKTDYLCRPEKRETSSD